jgi:DNA primase catalytic core
MIPQEYIDEILNKIDIVDLISAEISLSKGGANYFGTCPFHRSSGEKSNGSFTVSPKKRFYHCFGCGAHGSVIQFCIQYKGLGFVDAVDFLAARAGLPPPSMRPSKAQVLETFSEKSQALERASDYYRQQLRISSQTIEFLKTAGISGITAGKFKLGYAPKGWQSLQAAFGTSYEPTCLDAGLAIKTDKGHVYDRFRERLIYPLIDYKGRVIGLAGQTMRQQRPEYLKTSLKEADVGAADFFGFGQAEKQIHIQRSIILVPTCLDVLVLHEYGFHNTVAVARTSSMKDEHFHYLFKKTEKIICFSPNTRNGRLKAWKMMKHALSHISGNRSVHFALVPAREEATSLVQKDRGPERIELMLKAAIPLSEFFLQQLVARNEGKTVEGRAALLDDASGLLSKIVDPNLKRLMSSAVDDLAHDRLILLRDVEEHDRWLAEALSRAIESIIIVSPWITRQGIERFELCDLIRSAVSRGVSVTVYTDVDFNVARRRNSPTGDLFDDGAFSKLTNAGAEVTFVSRIHSKVVVCDSQSLAIGSFNWLSAARAGQHRRQEVSVIHATGAIASERQLLLRELLANVVKYPDDISPI